jgi:DNA-directed RNA polymerase subunit L/DNA-directed RNA polymerase alpha subunit
MTTESVFKNLATVVENPNMLAFQLTPTSVAYANTLRRMILIGTESVAFNSTMNEKGETSDVTILENTTPMTNEMLADRIGLIPIHADPATWKKDDYYFELKVENTSDSTLRVKASDIEVWKRGTVRRQEGGSNANENLENEEGNNFGNNANSVESNTNNINGNETVRVVEVQDPNVRVNNKEFFHRNPKTLDTCLIALLKAKQPNQAGQKIHFIAKASVGTGRDHIRYSPVCQCSYGYTIDANEERQQEQFEKWIRTHKNKKLDDLEEEEAKVLMREFQTMEVQRCYKLNPATGEPNSFDFVVETVGVQSVDTIVERALKNIQTKCLKYAAMDKAAPESVRVQHADARMKGFDFIFQKEDHTLGNLLQSYMDENMMDKDVTFVGYKVPHPLRDEMVLRVGVDFPLEPERDGKEIAAREAVAKAATACADMFGKWLVDWQRSRSEGRGTRTLASLRPTAATQKEVESSANLAKQMVERQQGGKQKTK